MDCLVNLLRKLVEGVDTTPTFLAMSQEQGFIQKIKELLQKYALYSEAVHNQDSTFNGFGVWQCEFIGTKENLETFMLVAKKFLYDYIVSYYGKANSYTEASFEKIDDNYYILKILYSFNPKTHTNIKLYKEALSQEERKKSLDDIRLRDDDLERELEKWKD